LETLINSPVPATSNLLSTTQRQDHKERREYPSEISLGHVTLIGVLLLSYYEDGVPRMAFFIEESPKIVPSAIATVVVAGRVG